MPTIAELLDLPLAWRRTKEEMTRDRCFAIHPHERRLIEADETTWLQSLRRDLEAGRYHPGPLQICQVPKPRGAVRPGGHLALRDHAIYNACVGVFSDQIRAALLWDDRPRDFSYPIARNPSSTQWLDNPFLGWKAFGDKSLEQLDDGSSHVVIADIAGFYENIDIALLLSDLRALSVDSAVLQQLSACLNRWSLSHISGRGVPQGFTASDILARLYLHSVDRGLSDRGVFHYRYVDDYRLFSTSRPDAKRTLVELITVLRKRGLVLQTAKSGIYTVDQARPKIAGIQPILQGVLAHFVDEIAELFGISGPYFTLWDAEQLIAANPSAAPLAVIRQAYTQYIVEGDPRSFDKTLFHFLIKRLGNAQDRHAYPHCLLLLQEQPQETAYILRYVQRVGAVREAEPAIVGYLMSPEAVYAYQVFQTLDWRLGIPDQPADHLVGFVRHLVFDLSPLPYLRAVAREFLARFGSLGDVDRLEDYLAVAHHDLERAELVCCIRRIEAGRRNGILARVQGESPFTANAVALVRRGALDQPRC